MKKLLLIPLLFIVASCSSSKLAYNSNLDFKLQDNIVYVDGQPYAKLRSISYGIKDKKERYEAIFVLEDSVDVSISRDLISYVSNIRPSWDVQVQSEFKDFKD